MTAVLLPSRVIEGHLHSALARSLAGGIVNVLRARLRARASPD